MFIAPQHFQQQERHFRHYVQQYVNVNGRGPRYGLCELEIDRERLKIGKIAVKLCRGLFPDGSYFESHKELLLEVPEGTINKTVFLALPLAVDGELEFGSIADQRRYFSESAILFDAVSEGNASVETQLSQPNARLMLEGEDTTGLTTLPIGRILERRESGSLVMDQRFIPASLQYGAAALLTERLQELQVLIESRAQAVIQRIKGGQSRKSELTLQQEYLWLQTLNRWIPWVTSTLDNPSYPTDQLYLNLCTLRAELCSLEPSIAEAAQALSMDNLAANFHPLFSQLREQLSLVQQDSVLEYSWDDRLFAKRRLLRASIGDIQRLEQHRFILAIESSIGAAALQQLIPSACKLCGQEQIVEVVRNSLSAVTLAPLPVAPSELKSRPDVVYVEIDTHHPYWRTLVDARDALALHVDSRIPDIHVQLFALE